MNLTVPLNTGATMPVIGLGTADPMYGILPPGWLQGPFARIRRALYWRIVIKIRRSWRGFLLSLSVARALRGGYRMIDTSAAYHNEREIRRGIRWGGIPREQLFLITRVSNQQQWDGDIRKALMESLANLGVEYVDLYMFHWPVPETYIQTWKEMEKLNREGLARAIGVANCHRHHLERLQVSAVISPAVNEFEIHPLMSQRDLVEFCQSSGMAVIAYTPIGRFHSKLSGHPALKTCAAKYHKSIPQIILRWHYQRGIVTIPRSSDPRHIRANRSVFDFELSADEMVLIDGVNEDLRLRYDPDNCDFTKL